MNNNDQQPNYDPSSATLNWSWLERHGLRDEADFDRYVTTLGVLPQANDAINVGVDPAAPPAEWNFYGDNTCGFLQVAQPEDRVAGEVHDAPGPDRDHAGTPTAP